MVYSPLEQFEIFPLIPLRLGSLDLSFSNSSLLMLFSVMGFSFMMLATARTANWQTRTPASAVAERLSAMKTTNQCAIRQLRHLQSAAAPLVNTFMKVVMQVIVHANPAEKVRTP